MIKYARGTIWWANLDTDDKSKPVLIISNNEFNANHSTLTVLPITHNNMDDAEFRVEIDTSTPNKSDRSYVMCDQIKLIGKEALDNFYGVVSDWEMLNIQYKMASYLNIPTSIDADILDKDIG